MKKMPPKWEEEKRMEGKEGEEKEKCIQSY